MDKESFLETVRKQYTEEIHEVYLECSHQDRSVDFVKLNQGLARLMQSASVQGLRHEDFEDLVRSTLPQVFSQLRLPKTKAA
jgi:hypothetical protein